MQNSRKAVLYISFDGMTDPLGQSQVIPYLQGLQKHNYDITLISFEKKDRYFRYSETISSILSESGIKWTPLSYTTKPPVISTLWDLYRLKRKFITLHKIRNFELLHCRSYISALMGLHIKRKYNIPFLFDMRGFWANERVDGELWSLKNPLYQIIFKYFKRKEKEFFRESTHIISLTNTGKTEILNNITPGIPAEKITIIPCCADTELFNIQKDQENSSLLRNKLNIPTGSFVFAYLGSIGTWYMTEEMLDFFSEFKKKYINAIFLFITKDDPLKINSYLTGKDIDADSIRIMPAERKEIPELLSLCKFTMFFLKPAYSHKARSPVKLGESLCMGVPVLCNSNIGDNEQILTENNAGLIVDITDSSSYKLITNKIDSIISIDKYHIRNTALKYFRLEDGIKKYVDVYNSIT